MRRWSKKVEYNGIEFNSTLELKYALMIEDSCEYMIEPVTIWYNRMNLDLRRREECPHRYVPDFLIRNVRDNSACLIEVKPAFLLTDPMVRLKKQLAERYIAEHQHTWKFHIITDRQIMLSGEKREKFDEIIKTRGFLAGKKKLLRLEKRFNENFIASRNKVPFHTNLDLEERDHVFFLKKGFVREHA